MKRLTMRNSDGSVSQPTTTTVAQVFCRLAEYEDTGLTPEEVLQLKGERFSRKTTAKEYRDAEEAGLLIRLPCKLGSSIWRVVADRKGKAALATFPEYRVYEYRVFPIYGGKQHLSIYAKMVLSDGTLSCSYEVFDDGDFGKTLFTSKEDALKEVERRNGEHHEVDANA